MMNERLLFEQMLDLYASQREADQQQRIRCQRGEHDLLATASPGVVVCRLCRTLGVCLWCGLTLPHGAYIGAVQWQARHQRTVEAGTLKAKETPHHES
jgi:hypothetical protein